MTGWQVFGMVMLPVTLFLMAIANEKHREEHGVSAPSRKAMARIRRNARKKGVSTKVAYGNWLSHKQRQDGPQAAIPTPTVLNAFGTSASSTASVGVSASTQEPATIREWRRASGLSVREIANRLELPEHILQQIENGTRAGDAETIERLVAFMREARDALPETPTLTEAAPPAAPAIFTSLSRSGTGGYVAGHFRKDGTWVKPHWRKPRGYR